MQKISNKTRLLIFLCILVFSGLILLIKIFYIHAFIDINGKFLIIILTFILINLILYLFFLCSILEKESIINNCLFIILFILVTIFSLLLVLLYFVGIAQDTVVFEIVDILTIKRQWDIRELEAYASNLIIQNGLDNLKVESIVKKHNTPEDIFKFIEVTKVDLSKKKEQDEMTYSSIILDKSAMIYKKIVDIDKMTWLIIIGVPVLFLGFFWYSGFVHFGHQNLIAESPAVIEIPTIPQEIVNSISDLQIKNSQLTIEQAHLSQRIDDAITVRRDLVNYIDPSTNNINISSNSTTNQNSNITSDFNKKFISLDSDVKGLNAKHQAIFNTTQKGFTKIKDEFKLDLAAYDKNNNQMIDCIYKRLSTLERVCKVDSDSIMADYYGKAEIDHFFKGEQEAFVDDAINAPIQSVNDSLYDAD